MSLFGSGPGPELGGLRLVTSEHITKSYPRKLTRVEAWRCLVEDAFGRVRVRYPFPRVRRTEERPLATFYRVGGTLLCHPALARDLRDIIRATTRGGAQGG